ncbi:MAG TPA: hypothetical protein VHZ76_00250 [Gammaproteobacteria bacterium]|jgi:hypothetical protein|nr:hypothetical protein [Gammaproteobacteria bacterium]
MPIIKLNYEEKTRWLDKADPYFFANDAGLIEAVINVVSQPSTTSHESLNQDKPAQVALLVGNSYLFSLAPLLHKKFNKIYVCDMDSVVLRFLEDMYLTMQQVETPEKFIETFINDISIKASAVNCTLKEYLFKFTPKEIREYFEREQKKHAKNHFLYNQENFDRAKIALNQLQIQLVHIDLSNNAQIDLFRQELKQNNEVIAFSNLTNIGDYIEDLSVIAELPFSPQTQLACSLRDPVKPTFPEIALYSGSIKDCLTDFEIRKKLYWFLHTDIYVIELIARGSVAQPDDEKINNAVKKHKELALKIRSCKFSELIQIPNVFDVSPLRFFAVLTPDPRLLKRLLNYPGYKVEQAELQGLIDVINNENNEEIWNTVRLERLAQDKGHYAYGKNREDVKKEIIQLLSEQLTFYTKNTSVAENNSYVKVGLSVFKPAGANEEIHTPHSINQRERQPEELPRLDF